MLERAIGAAEAQIEVTTTTHEKCDERLGTPPSTQSSLANQGESSQSTPPAAVDSIHGVRVIAALAVVVHHFGALNVDFQAPVNNGVGRRLNELPWAVAYIAGVGPGNIAVETFLTVAGFVAAYTTWSKGGVAQSYEKRLFKRYFRIAIPLIPVHLVNGLLFHFGLTHGNYARTPSREEVASSYRVGLFRFIYASDLNGALWIVEEFFLAPFVAAAVQLPVLRLLPLYRGMWYLACFLYCVGNVFEPQTISQYLSVVVGVALADLYFHIYSRLDARGSDSPLLLTALSAWLVLLMLSPYLPVPFYNVKFLIRVSGWAFVCFALFVRKLRCVFSNCLMRRLSRYTYEVYIWHLVVFHFFAKSVTPMHEGTDLIGIYVLAIILVLVFAVVGYHAVERPGNWVTQKLIRYVFDHGVRKTQQGIFKRP